MPRSDADELRARLRRDVRQHQQRACTDNEVLGMMTTKVYSAVAGLLGDSPMTCEAVAEVIRSLPPAYRAALEAELRDATDDECRSTTIGVLPMYKGPEPTSGPPELVRAAFSLRQYFQANRQNGPAPT